MALCRCASGITHTHIHSQNVMCHSGLDGALDGGRHAGAEQHGAQELADGRHHHHLQQRSTTVLLPIIVSQYGPAKQTTCCGAVLKEMLMRCD